jgi:hypothetical protein
VVLRGFIDESYDRQIFVLSAVVGVGTVWRGLSKSWNACIEKRNERLRAQGRNTISRFHAAECNSQDNEYKGWSRPEQIEFMAELIGILGREELDSVAFALDIGDLYKAFPDARKKSKPDLLRTLYGIMTKFMILMMAPPYVAADPTIRITLVHDRCEYDGVIADAFRDAVEDREFKERGCYTAITPGSSLKVIPLQMADLIAHENFKEVKRRYRSPKGKIPKRRTSLKVMIAQGNFAGGVHYISLDALRSLARHVARGKGAKSKIQSD